VITTEQIDAFVAALPTLLDGLVEPSDATAGST
jgi:hypothetical protein